MHIFTESSSPTLPTQSVARFSPDKTLRWLLEEGVKENMIFIFITKHRCVFYRWGKRWHFHTFAGKLGQSAKLVLESE